MRKFLLTAVLLLTAAVVFAQEQIAVFPFEDMNNVLTRAEAVMFYREFGIEFANRNAGRFSIVPRLEVERLISTEMDFQLTVFSAQEKTAEMMRVQNATQILSGAIGTLNNEIRISVSLYTYPDLVQLPGGAVLSVANTSELFNKIPELVQSMYNVINNESVQPLPEGLLYEIIDGRTVTITRYNSNVAELNIPSRIEELPVTSIRDGAFSDLRSLISVTIPSSITSIGERALAGSLTSITVDSRNPAYASVDGVLFDKNIRTLIRYPQGKNQSSYIIPSSVTSIGGFAFSSSSLTSLTIPSSVTSIGEYAFAWCSRLTNVTIPSSVISIRNRVFNGCSSLTSVTIPSSVRSIGDDAFGLCESLTNITIPSSVRSIGRAAFMYCRSLTSVTIPSSVTSIGGSAFQDCRSLISVTIPSSVTSIGDYAFSGCSSLTSVTIPSSVTTIVRYAFSGCSSLTSITIPSSVRTIGEYAFRGCSSLTSVTIPSSVRSIEQGAFRDCRSLTSVTIPSSVTFIGPSAFYGCDNLTRVTLSRRTQVVPTAFPERTRITYRD
jgi:hypothetical protein